MAYKLSWSPAARDNPERAMSFGYELISQTDQLQTFPEFGRVVPEYRSHNLREIIFRPYRIVYRVNHDRRLCEIARCRRQMPAFQTSR